MKSLNDSQHRAVWSGSERKVVIAGPGSGKTFTMVEAIKVATANLIDIPQPRIAVMTFTNAGANEFRSRLGDIKMVHCGTLHSYCFKLMQAHGDLVGYVAGKIGILPEEDEILRLQACAKTLGKSLSIEKLTGKKPCKPGQETIDRVLIWAEYEFLLKRNNLVDYDGILRVGLELIYKVQPKLDYLFVDEAQDSASIDWMIYDALQATNAMFVGDPDQSIFGFRGAHINGLLECAEDPETELITLETNYRSAANICTLADNLIAYNEKRVKKVNLPVLGNGAGLVAVMNFDDPQVEMSWLGANMPKGVTTGVLLRTNALAKQYRDYLTAAGLPVFKPKFERKPTDWELALVLLGILIAPSGILYDRLARLIFNPKQVDQWQLRAASQGLEYIPYIHPVQEPRTWDSFGQYMRQNGVGESTTFTIRSRVELLGPDATLTDLVRDLHSTEEPKEDEGSGISVLTMHAAKGREFDVVFLPAFEQGIIPNARDLMTDASGVTDRTVLFTLEEERRLAFVAITRARANVYISHCSYRRGPWGPIGGAPSQFIREAGL